MTVDFLPEPWKLEVAQYQELKNIVLSTRTNILEKYTSAMKKKSKHSQVKGYKNSLSLTDLMLKE